jgi:hypothetical protein
MGMPRKLETLPFASAGESASRSDRESGCSMSGESHSVSARTPVGWALDSWRAAGKASPKDGQAGFRIIQRRFQRRQRQFPAPGSLRRKGDGGSTGRRRS